MTVILIDCCLISYTQSCAHSCTHALPSPLQFADVLQVGCPVQFTSSLILKPASQLLPVNLQEICEEHLVENLTATQDLVNGGTRTYVHEQLATNIA